MEERSVTTAAVVGRFHMHRSGAGLGLQVLVDATGARCSLFETLGFSQTLVLRSARAIGALFRMARPRCFMSRSIVHVARQIFHMVCPIFLYISPN